MKKCAQCGFMYYCSKECQPEDWCHLHKYECRYEKKMVETKSRLLTNDQGMLCFRFCIKTHFDKEIMTKTWKLFDGRERKIDDLVDHVDDIMKETPQRYFQLVAFAEVMMRLDISFDLKTIIKRCGQVKINTFAIQDELSSTTEILGNGLYIEASIFNHSCRANAGRVFNGTSIEIRAWSEINTSAEEITLIYGHGYPTSDERKRSLRDFYYSDCQCELCATDTGLDHDSKTLTVLMEQMMMAFILRNQSLSNLKYVEIKRIISKHYGDYNVIFLHLLKTQLGVLFNQHVIANEAPSPLYNHLLADFKLQATVIYGLEHPYTQHFLKKFQSLCVNSWRS